jgi:hypothetical protein
VTAALTATAVRRLRLAALLLSPGAPTASTVAEVVTWFGAMQAQDLGSVQWSFGIRLPGTTVADIDAAFERREALRTWPMRGTVHAVPARDAHWMLELMGAGPLAGAAKRREFLGLSEHDADRACDVLGSALASGGRLTRAACLAELERQGITGAGNYGYHLLWYASQRGVTCIAPHVDGEQTFVLLDEWVPDPRRLERDEALATIATRFVRSHGPVRVQDLAGWTGLGVRDARAAVALAGDAVTTVEHDGQDLLVGAELLDVAGDVTARAHPVTVPPGFDELVLGYKDRSLLLEPAQFDAVVPGGNGVFRPTLVRDGRVVGTWRRLPSKTKAIVEVTPFDEVPARVRTRAEQALAGYATFLGRPLEVRWA